MPKITYLKCNDKDKNIYGNVVQNLNIRIFCNDTKNVHNSLAYYYALPIMQKKEKEKRKKKIYIYIYIYIYLKKIYIYKYNIILLFDYYVKYDTKCSKGKLK